MIRKKKKKKKKKVTGPSGPVIIACHWPELARRLQIAGGPVLIVEACGVNHPSIVRETSHFGLFPAFFPERPAFLALFRINKINENRTNFTCPETFCSKKLCGNVSDSVT